PLSGYSPRDRHDVHSFPTRRSSDLLVLGVAKARGKAGDRHAVGRVNPDHVGALRAQEALVALRLKRIGTQDAMLAADPHVAELGDRKSTRLNSSHVKISYAVFCLKK